MNTPESDRCVCEQCGALLSHHTRDGLCSRCLARFSLLEVGDGKENAEGGGQRSEVREPEAHAPPKTQFGDYELLEEIARGGMGVVYRARQVSLNRIVAVKMALFGQFAGKTALERFRAEAETAARLQHPNIVAIHGIGETDGQPYFSMDYVAGRNLAELVRGRPLPVRQAAGYVRRIALAVHYAHGQGVLHRDLKPANVLIDEADEPRVTDFGLARRLAGDSEFTLSGQVVGSPNFMPPEQGAGKNAKVGPASDVYGLGALLYYLLTARPPFMAQTFEATLAQVLETEPVEPRQLNPGLPLDLETICLRCLEKDPARRYASAAELADELDRFLEGKPIRARPVGPAGKLWRWCRRKPVVAAMSTAVIALLLTVTVVSLTAALRIAAEARHTEEKARDLRLNLYVSDMNVAYQAALDNNLGVARQIISKYLPEGQGTQEGATKQAASGQQEDLRGWEWRYLWGLCRGESLATLRGHSGYVVCALFSPDGRKVVTAGFDKTVRIWDTATRRTVRVLTGFADKLQRNSVAFSPNGQTLAVADGNEIHVFDTANWNKLLKLPNQVLPGHIFSLPITFSPDGKTLSCNEGTEIRHWDTASWEQRISQPANLVRECGYLLVYSSDGRHFATAKDDGIVIWDTSSNPPGQRFFGPLRSPSCVTFSAHGRLVAATGDADHTIVWDVEQAKEVMRLPTGPASSVAVAFSPDGRQLATGGPGSVRLWEIEQGRLIATLKGAQSGIWVLEFSPDGRTLVTGSQDEVRLWSALPEPVPRGVLTTGNPLSFSPDSQVLALFATNSCVEYWDVRSGNIVASFKIPVTIHERDKVATSPNGAWVVHVGSEGKAQVWERGTGERVAELVLNPPPKSPRVSFSRDSHLLAVSCTDRARGGGGWVRLWDFQKREVRAVPGADVYMPAFSWDGRLLATGSGYDVQVWSISDLKRLATLRGHSWSINGLAFSPDGALLASMGRDSELCLWEVATGRLRLSVTANPQGNGLTAAAFNADGRTLGSGGTGGSAGLWNVASGRVVVPLARKHRHLQEPMFSPDGNTLALGGYPIEPAPVPLELFRAPPLAEIDAVEKAERESP